MQVLLIQAGGALAIAIALIHAVLGETRVFANAVIEPPFVRRLVYLVWQANTVAWIGYGGLLLAAPMLGPGPARTAIVATAAVVFACLAAVNAIATRGRHFGWMLLAIVVALLLASYVV